MHALSGYLQGMLGDPQMMAEMMNNPLVQGLLSDPEMVRTILQSNPAIREVRALCNGSKGLVGIGAQIGQRAGEGGRRKHIPGQRRSE